MMLKLILRGTRYYLVSLLWKFCLPDTQTNPKDDDSEGDDSEGDNMITKHKYILKMTV